jgi:DNA repair protein RecO (recombination protein O)
MVTSKSRVTARAAPWDAFVLHSYPWSESSLILDVFTREGGRLSAVAKGAKRPTSQQRAVLLPFQRLHVSLTRRADQDDQDAIQTLRHAEWAGRAGMGSLLRGDALFRGFYLNELLMKLLPRHDPHPVLFDAYALTLQALAQPDLPSHASHGVVRAFEMTLLQALGWLPDLSVVTLTQRPVRATERYTLRSDGGLTTAAADTDALAGEHWLRLHEALRSQAHAELRHACEAAEAAPLRGMLRHVLATHLGPHELRTREVALGLKRLGQGVRARAARAVRMGE